MYDAVFADQDLLEANGPVLGNCWSVSVANLFGLRVKQVPHFVDLYREPGEWYLQTNLWLRTQFSYELQRRTPTFPLQSVIPRILLTGDSPRGDWQHAVLADTEGQILHDPHPSRDGLRTIEDAYVVAVAS